MNIRVFAVLFGAVLMAIAAPAMLVQPSGTASAGLSAGFVLPFENVYHVAALVGIGLLAAWFGGEAMVILPLSALLMLAIGAMMQIDDHVFRAVHAFTGGAIIVFALSVSMLRRKTFLLSIPPIAIWVFFAADGYMNRIPDITTPLYFLMGTIISAGLLMAIGVSFGITLTESLRDAYERLKTVPTFQSLFSFF